MTTLQQQPKTVLRKTSGLASQLASAGGPRAVSIPYKERWKNSWWKDGLRIARRLKWGATTFALREGPSAEFEERFAGMVGCKHALAMNSGTAALHSGLFAVGIGPGDEVIVPSYTWHASASAILCCGGRPVFCDIDPRTLTADPDDIAARITPRTKAIMVVHIWGNPAQMDRIMAVANTRGIPVVEDCSHAHGARYQGNSVGLWGAVGCFSLQGGKAVSAGEGGVAITNSREYYERMLALGHPIRAGVEIANGQQLLGTLHLGPKYRANMLGMVLALAGLNRLEELNALRRRNWGILEEELRGCDAIRPVGTLPGALRGGFLEFKLLVNEDYLTCETSEFVKHLKAEGVPASSDRYGMLHKHPILRKGGPITADLLSLDPSNVPAEEYLPNTESLSGRVITLPAFADVSEIFARQVGVAIRKVVDAHSG